MKRHILTFSFIAMALLLSMMSSRAIAQKSKSMKTIHLNQKEFLERVYNYDENPTELIYKGDKPAIIDFYASWCGPCKAIAPILEELAAEYADQIYIYKIDTDAEQGLASYFNIRSIPSLLFIPMEGKPTMMQGAMPKAELKKSIDELLLNK